MIEPDKAKVLEWDAERVSKWVSSMGLGLYAHHFVENNITGDALVHLDQTDLGEVGVQSVGHRLRILKAVYELIVKQDIQVDGDYYIPPTVLESHKNTAKQVDPSIAHSFEIRDERVGLAEDELRKLVDYYHRLRQDLLPLFRLVKENKPLPTPETNSSASPLHNHHPAVLQPQVLSPTLPSLTTSSPPPLTTTSNGPLSATTASASTHLPTPREPTTHREPSPTSASQPSSLSSAPAPSNTSFTNPEKSNNPVKRIISKSSLSNLPLNSRSPTTASSNSEWLTGSEYNKHHDSKSSTPSPSEPFKSFRVTMEDPCYKVLPAALKKYKINGDWKEYALLVCYGDQERYLGMEEKPLIIFKELQDAGKKPVFMLRHMKDVGTTTTTTTSSSSSSNTTASNNTGGGNKQGVVVSGTPGGVF